MTSHTPHSSSSNNSVLLPANALTLVSNGQRNATGRPKTAALAVDGAMLSMYARARDRQPDLQGLGAWAERVAGARLESKHWYDATPDEKPNQFHFAARSAGYSVQLGPLTTHTSTLGLLTITRVKQVGVDIDLAMSTYRSYMNGSWTTLVLVAGDGDFFRLPQYLAEHGVRVILLRDPSSTNKKLEKLVSETYDMSAVIDLITRPRSSGKAA